LIYRFDKTESEVFMGNSIRILFVEDSDDAIAESISTLKRGGFEVISRRIDSVEGLLNAFHEPDWDLILAAHDVPGLDGFRLLDLVHQYTKNIPCLFVTEVLDEETVVDLMRAGARDCIIHGQWLRLNKAVQRELEIKLHRLQMLQTENFYQMLLENITNPVFLTDEVGKFSYVCANVKHVLGYTAEEILAFKNIEKLFGKNIIQIEGLRNVDDYYELETSLLDKQGLEHFFQTSVKRVGLQHGELLFVCTDISHRKKAQEELIESEKKFQTLYNLSPDAIILAEAESGLIIDANEVAEKLFEKPLNQIIGIHQSKLHPDFQSEKAAQSFAYRPAHPQEEVPATEIEILCGDGSQKMVEIRGKAFWFSGKEYALGAFRDITQRKKAEYVLWETWQSLQALIDAIEDSMLLIEPDGRIVACNEAVAARFGKRKEGLVGTNVYELVNNQVGDVRRQYAAQVLETAKPVWFIDERNGRLINNAVFPVLNQDGRVVRLAILGQDITERKVIEAALRESEEKYRTMFENMAEGVFYQSADGTMIDVNAAALEIFGLAREEFLGSTSYDEVWQVVDVDGKPLPPAERPSIIALKTGQFVQKDDVGIYNSQKQAFTWLRIFAKPQFRPGENEPYQVFVTLHEVTARKQAQEEINRLLQSVTQQREELRSLAARLAEAEENERRRIARELHDQVGQNLSALGINLNILSNQLPDYLMAYKKRVKDSIQLTDQTTERIRTMMTELHSTILEDFGLLAALKWAAQQFYDRFTIPVALETNLDMNIRFSEKLEIALFRIAQEALSNIARHAAAKNVFIGFHQNKTNELVLLIRDDGIGFDSQAFNLSDPSGWGLRIMSERAILLNAKLEIVSKPGSGCSIAVNVKV
jgi:PAS domain S-box-containing protein